MYCSGSKDPNCTNRPAQIILRLYRLFETVVLAANGSTATSVNNSSVLCHYVDVFVDILEIVIEKPAVLMIVLGMKLGGVYFKMIN